MSAPTRWLLLAAMHGECCPHAHVHYRRTSARKWEAALDRFKTDLTNRGFDVNEAFAISLRGKQATI